MFPDDEDDGDRIIAQGGMVALIVVSCFILAVGFILGWVIMSRC